MRKSVLVALVAVGCGGGVEATDRPFRDVPDAEVWADAAGQDANIEAALDAASEVASEAALDAASEAESSIDSGSDVVQDVVQEPVKYGPTVIAKGIALNIRAYGKSVYWTSHDMSNGTIWRKEIPGGKTAIVAAIPGKSFGGFAVVNDRIWFSIVEQSSSVGSVSIKGGAVQITVTEDQSSIREALVDGETPVWISTEMKSVPGSSMTRLSNGIPNKVWSSTYPIVGEAFFFGGDLFAARSNFSTQSRDIVRVKSDGSPEEVLAPGQDYSSGVVVDAKGRVFWGSAYGPMGQSSGLFMLEKGSPAVEKVKTTKPPRFMAVDADHIYWDEETEVRRASMSDWSAETVFTASFNEYLNDVEVDAEFIYWGTSNQLMFMSK
jgi:hypothetical protein